MSTLQTLDRGLTVLEIVAQSPRALSVSEIADQLGVHRTIVYRIIGTLHEHGLVTRTHTGRVRLGAATAVLSRSFAPQLVDVARPMLKRLCARTTATAFLSAVEGEECVVIMVEEPTHQGIRVSYQVGTRHPIHRGAPGIAVLAMRPASPDDPEDVQEARRRGYSITRGQLQAGAVGVSVGLRDIPLLDELDLEATVGVVALTGLDEELAAEATADIAAELCRVLGE